MVLLGLAFFVWNGVGKVLFRKWLDQPDSNSTDFTAVYAPAQCAFRVTFPTTPEIGQLSSPGVTFIERAQSTFENHFLRATCMTFPDGNFGNMTQTDYHQMGRDYAEKEGLHSILIQHSSSGMGDRVMVSGSKTIQGLSFKVRTDMYHRDNVRFTVTVGGETTGYPQSGVLQFLQSVVNI